MIKGTSIYTVAIPASGIDNVNRAVIAGPDCAVGALNESQGVSNPCCVKVGLDEGTPALSAILDDISMPEVFPITRRVTFSSR